MRQQKFPPLQRCSMTLGVALILIAGCASGSELTAPTGAKAQTLLIIGPPPPPPPPPPSGDEDCQVQHQFQGHETGDQPCPTP